MTKLVGLADSTAETLTFYILPEGNHKKEELKKLLQGQEGGRSIDLTVGRDNIEYLVRLRTVRERLYRSPDPEQQSVIVADSVLVIVLDSDARETDEQYNGFLVIQTEETVQGIPMGLLSIFPQEPTL